MLAMAILQSIHKPVKQIFLSFSALIVIDVLLKNNEYINILIFFYLLLLTFSNPAI